MVLRRFRRKRDPQARRYAYSRWDGSQSGFDLNAYDLLAELGDELIHHGDPNSALRNLLQNGFDADGNRVQGLRELLEQLAEERRQRLENHDLGGVYDDIAQQLRDLLSEEREALEQLAQDARASNYDFQSADAQQRFDDLMQQLREQLMQQQLDQMSAGVNDMSPEDMQRLKDMMSELNNMLDQRSRGEEPDFDAFMQEYGDFFPENPQTLDELLEVMAQRMAAAQAMLNSMTPEQRAQLQSLSDQLLEDMDLKWQVDQLGQNLQQMFPDAGWQRSYDFSGFDPLDMGSAMDMMGDLNERSPKSTSNELGSYSATMLPIRWNSWGNCRRCSKTRASSRTTTASLPYEWGDPFNLHIGKTIRNAITRTGGGTPVQLTPDDFEVERTENQVRSSTVLMLDMSLSMPMRDNFLPAKKVAMALYGLISSQYPRDYLGVVGFSDVATVIEPTKLPGVQWDFVYGTNMQHGFMLARDMLAKQTGTKQIIMITDGEPTAHLDDAGRPHFNYPPIQETIDKTLIEVNRCTRENIRINVFMLDATPYLTRFIEKITQLNGGRAFFTTPQTLGDYVLVDFVEHKRAMRTGRR